MKVPNNDLLIATGNEGKLREFAEKFGSLGIKIRGLKDLPEVEMVEETGASFLENAVLKACCYGRQSGMRTLADDSGLEVSALDGAPGIKSARFGSERLDYPEKIAHLLKAIEQTGSEDRSARFVSVIAIADDRGKLEFTAEGICPGKLTTEPRGTNGFGYDPIFVPEGYSLTFAELPSAVKTEISHRARALSIIMRYLGHSTAI
jgi:XTP/dITP diphosphohydrolase